MRMSLFARAANALGKPFGINPFSDASKSPWTPEATSRKQAFDTIYNLNGWNSPESRSGAGSEAARAADYLADLLNILNELNVQKLFDAPCGDLNWILPAVKGRKYVGGDIAPSLISDLQKAHPDLDLIVFDICTDSFPVADVWHCRDCLFHLPIGDIQSALANFASSTIPYALITTHRSRWLHRNIDVPAGGWRYLDLEKAPFNFPKPLRYLKDFRRGRDFPRYVGLWTREQLSAALRGNLS